MSDNLFDLTLKRAMETILNRNRYSQSPYLCFTQEVWDYIEENYEPFMPGVKRIVLPDRFELEEKLNEW